MGDSETIIAETSSVMSYAYTVPNTTGSNSGDGTTYSINPNSTIQKTSIAVGVTDGSGNAVGTENSTSASSQVAGYGSANGNIASEEVNVQLTENGNSVEAASVTTAGQNFGDASGVYCLLHAYEILILLELCYCIAIRRYVLLA